MAEVITTVENAVSGTVGSFRKTISDNKGYAVGLIVGITLLVFIQSLIDNLVMPLLTPLIGSSETAEWSDKEWVIGKVRIKTGKLLASLLSLVITILVTYLTVRSLA